MKIFSVRIHVEIGLVATLPDELPETTAPPQPFNDDPLDKQSKMMDDYLNKAAKIFNRAPMVVAGIPGQMGDSASMTIKRRRNFQRCQILCSSHTTRI